MKILLVLAILVSGLSSFEALAAPPAASATIAQDYASQVLSPVLSQKGWTAKVYQSSILRDHALLWITPGGLCSQHFDFVLDVTDPANPKTYFIVQGINNGNNAYDAPVSDALTIGIPLEALIKVGIEGSFQELGDTFFPVEGVLQLFVNRPATESTLINAAEIYAAGARLKQSAKLFASGSVTAAQAALPSITACVYESK